MAWSKRTFIDPPAINLCCAWFWLLVNIFCPGVGTMIIGIFTCSCENFMIGIVQLIFAPIIIGWVWSIWWGCDLISVSKHGKDHGTV